MKLIPRLVQAWDGVVVVFQKGSELLKDYFTVVLSTEERIKLLTRCGAQGYNSHWIANNSLVELPFYCSAFSPGKIFLRPTLMKRKNKEEPADSMLQRQAKAPALSIRISKNKLREKTNRTQASQWAIIENREA